MYAFGDVDGETLLTGTVVEPRLVGVTVIGAVELGAVGEETIGTGTVVEPTLVVETAVGVVELRAAGEETLVIGAVTCPTVVAGIVFSVVGLVEVDTLLTGAVVGTPLDGAVAFGTVVLEIVGGDSKVLDFAASGLASRSKAVLTAVGSIFWLAAVEGEVADVTVAGEADGCSVCEP
jgi:hypothetical protein